MFPELFEIPFIHLTVKSYGTMMVIAFLAAITLIRRLSRSFTPDPQYITNASLYSLIAGVVGSRLFYVIHHFDEFEGRLLSVFAIWEGGLELLGGVLAAIAVIGSYCRYHKLPVRRYLDILAIGLMLAILFGRIGCFLNGCCFGKPTGLPWGVRFPYGSYAYSSQVSPNPERNRAEPQLKLPDDFFHFYYENGRMLRLLKPYENLTLEQKNYLAEEDKYRCLPVHPTQLYSSVNGAVLALILYLFWRRNQKAGNLKNHNKLFTKPGCTFGLMFIIYGISRFFIEFVRDDNPFEFDGLTISQNIGLAMVVFGVILMLIFEKMKPEQPKERINKKTQK
ncbi:MAG: prolipoprotein diacylglyceryl transferase [Sedimentisphaerales bacterium]|nr:prolipoprotein diacylglyceryl transferase [Sedimentisphaerales bacterium]